MFMEAGSRQRILRRHSRRPGHSIAIEWSYGSSRWRKAGICVSRIGKPQHYMIEFPAATLIAVRLTGECLFDNSVDL
jgi:hypothetical protein